jgi:hypothetical protein
MTAPLMAGGLLRLWFEKRNYDSEEIKKETCDNGTLFASGLIAGEGLVGILLAVFAVLNMDFSLSAIDLGNFGGVAAFVVLAVIFCLFSKVKKA